MDDGGLEARRSERKDSVHEHHKLTLLSSVTSIKETKIYFFPFMKPLRFTSTHIQMLLEI